jgi:hypothetical protein
MRPAEKKAFEARQEERSGIYSFEQQNIQFERAQERHFRANEAAWKILSVATALVSAGRYLVGGQRETGRDEGKAVAALIDDSAEGRTVPQVTRRPTL